MLFRSYHSHPSNKDAVPSFVSIALHLRDLFNDLWQEHMLPSDFPPPPLGTGVGRSKPQDPHAPLRAAMEQRVLCRKKRLVVSGLSIMTGKCLERAAEALHDLIENGGLVDPLDTEPIWGEGVVLNDDDDGDLKVVLENFRNILPPLFKLFGFCFLEYKCSVDNTCNSHGECKDYEYNGYCLCRPGWTSKEDCSGN